MAAAGSPAVVMPGGSADVTTGDDPGEHRGRRRHRRTLRRRIRLPARGDAESTAHRRVAHRRRPDVGQEDVDDSAVRPAGPGGRRRRLELSVHHRRCVREGDGRRVDIALAVEEPLGDRRGGQPLLDLDDVGPGVADRVVDGLPLAVPHEPTALARLPDALEHVGTRREHRQWVPVRAVRVLVLAGRCEGRQRDDLVEVEAGRLEVEGDLLPVAGDRLVVESLTDAGVRALVGGHDAPLCVGGRRDVEQLEGVLRPAGDPVGGEGAGHAVLHVGAADEPAVLPGSVADEGEDPHLAAVLRDARRRREVTDQPGEEAGTGRCLGRQGADEGPDGERRLGVGADPLGVPGLHPRVEEDVEGPAALGRDARGVGLPGRAGTQQRAAHHQGGRESPTRCPCRHRLMLSRRPRSSAPTAPGRRFAPVPSGRGPPCGSGSPRGSPRRTRPPGRTPGTAPG